MKRIKLVILIITAAVQSWSQEPGRLSRLGTEDLSAPPDSMEMSVISASRSSKKIADLPISIYVVTRDEIMKNHYFTLIDVLKTLPGIRVSQPGNGELGETFQLRGLTGNLYTMILINGLPVKPGAVTGMPLLAQLPVRQAERIEVIYGPAAAIYGADAVSGVINIITREADKGTFVLGDVSIGQNDYRNTDFMVGGKTGKNRNILQYSFYGGLNEASDYNVRKGYDEVYNPLHYLQEKGHKYTIGSEVYEPLKITENVLTGAGINPSTFMAGNFMPGYSGSLTMPLIEDLPSESNLLGLNLKYRGVALSINNMYRRSHSSLGQSSYLFRYDNPQNYWGENIRSTTIGYNHEWGARVSTSTNISNLVYRMDNNSSMGVTFTTYTDKLYRYAASNDILFEQLVTVMPARELEIMSGVTYRRSSILPQTSFLDSPFNPGDYRFFSTDVDKDDPVTGKFGLNPLIEHNLSFFTQSYYSREKIRLMGGVRLDNNSHYGLSVNPRIAGLVNFNPRTSVRGSVGFAYMAPPASLSWQSLAYKSGSSLDSIRYLIIPNPDLEPENYMSVELGLVKYYRKKVSLNISIYYNSIKNLIMDRNIPLSELDLPLAIVESDSADVLTKTNNKKAVSRLYGLQLTLRANDIIRSVHMNAELSLTFSKSSESFPDIFEIAGNVLGNFKLTPNHFGQLKLSMEPFKNFYMQISSIWESSWLRVIIPFKEIYSDIIHDVDGFYSMDVIANYRIGTNLSSFIRVSNVFDERYGGPVYSGMNASLPYSPQNGRTLQIGLTYNMN
ncbi:MAG: TonB-dependent receptor [Bacteroidales bacterium]